MAGHEKAKEHLPVAQIEELLTPYVREKKKGDSEKEVRSLCAVTLASIIDRYSHIR
jgi:hypothetical protein